MSAIGESAAKQAIMPVAPSERIQIIDILRGFALLGILLVNIELFSNPMQMVVLPLDAAVSGVDRAAAWLVRFIAEGKFYSLFSFLFGLGFALQITRAEERSARWGPVYLRRLLVLLGIGLIHALLIWVGDILMLYAILGFLLILYRKAKPKTLLVWVVIFLTLPVLLLALGTGAIEMGRAAGPEVAVQIDQSFAEQRTAYYADVERARTVYASGNFAQITQQRAYDMLSFMAIGNLFMAPSVFAMFLAGLYFGRRRLFQNIDDNLPIFRKLLWWGLIVGVIGNFIYATLSLPLHRGEPSPTLLVAMLGYAVGAPAFSLFFVAALTLLSRRAGWQKRLGLLSPVGRMALSNYLGQSIICTLIFYGYGLGLFGQVGKALNLVLAVIIYLGQVLLSACWMRWFRFGPAEWLWRSVTYMKFQPMRL